MPNMSYCRFQNTLTDFKECSSVIEDMVEAHEEENQSLRVLSADELKAAKELAMLAVYFLQVIVGAGSDDVENISMLTDSTRINEIFDNLNTVPPREL